MRVCYDREEFYCLRPIERYEELTCNYGLPHHDGKLPCKCGAKIAWDLFSKIIKALRNIFIEPKFIASHNTLHAALAVMGDERTSYIATTI